MLFKSALVLATIFLMSVTRKGENVKENTFSEHIFENVSLRVVLYQKNATLQPADFLKLLSKPSCKQKLEIRSTIVEDEKDSEGLKEHLELVIGHQNCVIENHSNNSETNGSTFRKLLGSIWLTMMAISDWFKRNQSGISGAILGVNFYLIIKGLMEYWKNYMNPPDTRLVHCEPSSSSQPAPIKVVEQQNYEESHSKCEKNPKQSAYGSQNKPGWGESSVQKKRRRGKNDNLTNTNSSFPQGFSSSQTNSNTEGYWQLLEKANKNQLK